MNKLTIRNLVLSFLISVGLTFGAALLYVFYPIIFAIIRIRLSNPETGGVTAVAGGASEALVLLVCLLTPVVFLLIFLRLQKR